MGRVICVNYNIKFPMTKEFFSIFSRWQVSNQSILSLRLASTTADLIPYPYELGIKAQNPILPGHIQVPVSSLLFCNCKSNLNWFYGRWQLEMRPFFTFYCMLQIKTSNCIHVLLNWTSDNFQLCLPCFHFHGECIIIHVRSTRDVHNILGIDQSMPPMLGRFHTRHGFPPFRW